MQDKATTPVPYHGASCSTPSNFSNLRTSSSSLNRCSDRRQERSHAHMKKRGRVLATPMRMYPSTTTPVQVPTVLYYTLHCTGPMSGLRQHPMIYYVMAYGMAWHDARRRDAELCWLRPHPSEADRNATLLCPASVAGWLACWRAGRRAGVVCAACRTCIYETSHHKHILKQTSWIQHKCRCAHFML